MNNKKNYDPYNTEPKKPIDKTKHRIHPCNKGSKCTYRKVDEDGYMIKNYCTFKHYPYDLCPYQEDCQFFQSQTCIWNHLTKPQPKPIQPAEIKTPLAQFLKMQQNLDDFPSIEVDNKSNPKTSNKPAYNQTQINKAQSQSQQQKSNKNTIKPTNITNKNAENLKANPESNSYLKIKPTSISNQIKLSTKSETQVKIQQNPKSYKESQKFQITQKSTLQNIKTETIKQLKQEILTERQSQAQLIELQIKETRDNFSVPIPLETNIQPPNLRQIILSQQIQKLAKQVLRYNANKNQFDYGDYQNTIKLAQILKLSNDLRPANSSRFQPQIHFESQSPLIKDQQLIRYEKSDKNFDARNSPKVSDTQISKTFKLLYPEVNIQNAQSNQQIRINLSLNRPNPRRENIAKGLNNLQRNQIYKNLESKPAEKKQKNSNNKKFLSQEEFSELSVDSKYPVMSQYFLHAFLSFLTEKDNIVFKFQVLKNQLQIIQKYFDSETGQYKNNNQKYYIYSTQVLQQSCFDEFRLTIQSYPYEIRKQQQKVGKQILTKGNRSSLMNQKEDDRESLKPSQAKIKQFFQHLFEYIQFYFHNLKKELRDQTLETLNIFFKPVQLPEDTVAANSSEIPIDDPNYFKGPIYVGGMRNICMRFFARIFILFLKNEQFVIKKVKKLMTAKGQVFDSKAVLRFLEAKREQVSQSLIGKQYEDNYECNKKKKPMDYKILEKEARNKFLSQMMLRSHHQIDQIMLGEKDTLLSWESMKEYIQLKVHEDINSDYFPETQIEPGKVQLIKMICKGQIEIESTDRKRYNMKEKTRYKFLKSFFMQEAIDDETPSTKLNEFISNERIRIGQKSFVTIFSDGKYIIEEPIEEKKIQIYDEAITKKLKQKTPQNPPHHDPKIYFYAKGNTGLGSCDLQAIAQAKFFKDKVLNFRKDSEYLVYCNQNYGFFGPDSLNTFKIRIHRQNGVIEFLNARNLEQCKRYFTQICEIIENIPKQSPKIQENRAHFYIKTKSYKVPLTYLSEATQEMRKRFSIESKEEKSLRFKRENLSIITWNLKSVFESDNLHRQIPLPLRVKSIIKDLKYHKADIVCLQEVKDFKKALQEELCEDNQLYCMPFNEDIGDFQTLILTRFPVKFFTMKLGSTKMACCEFEIQSCSETIKSDNENDIIVESLKNKQNKKVQKGKKLSVLVMSIHLKCTEMDSQDNFLASTQTRETQLNNLEQFFVLNEKENDKKYDVFIMAGDFNIDDEVSEYKEDGETLQTCDHNEKFLTFPPYFDLQADLHPETLETFKTYLLKGRMQSGKYVTGGSRLDRILVRTHSKTNVKHLISELSELSLVGDYSLRDKENVNETNFDKFTRSPSDHFGIYMEILFNL